MAIDARKALRLGVCCARLLKSDRGGGVECAGLIVMRMIKARLP
jgi:hypothetical protein